MHGMGPRGGRVKLRGCGAHGKEGCLVHDEPRDRRGTVAGDSALREGIAVGPLAFDRERWTAGADGRAAGHPPRMRAAWMVGAAAVAAVAVTAPGWLNTARIPRPFSRA